MGGGWLGFSSLHPEASSGLDLGLLTQPLQQHNHLRTDLVLTNSVSVTKRTFYLVYPDACCCAYGETTFRASRGVSNQPASAPQEGEVHWPGAHIGPAVLSHQLTCSHSTT